MPSGDAPDHGVPVAEGLQQRGHHRLHLLGHGPEVLLLLLVRRILLGSCHDQLSGRAWPAPTSSDLGKLLNEDRDSYRPTSRHQQAIAIC